MACTKPGSYEVLGESQDDAAGEAFDKVAKMLGLPYPGGPEVAKLALLGDNKRFRFPRPMTNKPGLNFSFSGLKTYTLNTLQDLQPASDQDKADIAIAFQSAVVDTIRIKCQRAFKETRHKTLIMAGGVSANVALRSRLDQMTEELDCNIYYPELKFCTDNGAMIAYAGFERLKSGQREGLSINVKPRWPMTELPEIA